MRTRLAALTALLLVAGCGFGEDGPVVIDGSSQEAFTRSLREAEGELGPKDRIKFQAAYTEFKARMFAKADNRQEYQRLIREGMDGLTAPRIVAQFNKDVDRVSGGAADALFDVKRAIKGGGDRASDAP